MAWTATLTDNAFVPVGEINNIYDLTVTLGLCKLDTASFRARLDNLVADELANAQGYVKIYRDKVLYFFGIILSASESGADSSIAVNCISTGWKLTKRIIGTKPNDPTRSPRTGDRAQLVVDELGWSEGTIPPLPPVQDRWPTGIVPEPGYGSGSIVTYTPGPYRPLMDMINELSAGVDGFDWRVLPYENYVGGAVSSVQTGWLRMKPIIGTERPDAIFEFGPNTSGTMANYTRTVTRDTQINRAMWVLQDNRNLTRINDTSIGEWGMLEEVIPISSDIQDGFLGFDILDQHLAVRSEPRVVVEFAPHIDPGRGRNLPTYGIDYELGDIVRGRAVWGRSVRFDGAFRVWEVSWTVDSNGLERANLKFTQE